MLNARRSRLLLSLFLLVLSATVASQVSRVQARIDQDLQAGKPLVVHVVVALADNEHQGIVPIGASLGNGERPDWNLYWGARFGMHTYFSKSKRWRRLDSIQAAARDTQPAILDHVLFAASLPRNGRNIPVRLYAEAWRGADIDAAIQRFLALSAGAVREQVSVLAADKTISETIAVAGDAHLIMYVGHNGLMDFKLPWPPKYSPRRDAAASAALACFSREDFERILRDYGSTPLLLTENLMAPEAYTVDATIAAFASAGEGPAVHLAAAKAYDQYQHCGLKAAKRLFWSPSDADN